ncbi:hypothetical protein KIH74_21265 [Kineosporia sp. J2-2]|uniref:Uncharacterized protein n=1 Tax=Kineosporia corallincola TaxID=2835133 RepID=A0ABS5TK55_9ACTN|nr:hypothetical protein [Kineosporia corallincola]MBT0771481.1 hypothetical protein [Kineosporia corallincola]
MIPLAIAAVNWIDGDPPAEPAASPSVSPPASPENDKVLLATVEKDWNEAVFFAATDTRVPSQDVDAINARYRRLLPSLGPIEAAGRALEELGAPRVDYVTGDRCNPVTGITPLKITFQSRQDDVIITDMQARIIDTHDLARRTRFAITPEGSGENVTGAFNLDSPDLSLVDDTTYGPGRQRYFDSHHITVRKNDPTVLQIHAYESTRLTQWVIDVTVVHEGNRSTVTLDDSGRPFRTTGVGSAAETAYAISPEDVEAGFVQVPASPIDLCTG